MYYENIRDGFGICFYPCGSIFKGTWQKGNYKGLGLYRDRRGVTWVGYFKGEDTELPQLIDGNVQI
jgi:hypothetical protein